MRNKEANFILAPFFNLKWAWHFLDLLNQTNSPTEAQTKGMCALHTNFLHPVNYTQTLLHGLWIDKPRLIIFRTMKYQSLLWNATKKGYLTGRIIQSRCHKLCQGESVLASCGFLQHTKWLWRDGASRAIKQVCGHKESFTLTRKPLTVLSFHSMAISFKGVKKHPTKLFTVIMPNHDVDVCITMRLLFGTTIATDTICYNFGTRSTAVWIHFQLQTLNTYDCKPTLLIGFVQKGSQFLNIKKKKINKSC